MRTWMAAGLCAAFAAGCSGSGKSSSSGSTGSTVTTQGTSIASSSTASGSSGSVGGSSTATTGHASSSSSGQPATAGTSGSSGTSASTSTGASSGAGSSGGTGGPGYEAFCTTFNADYCARLQGCGYLDPAFNCAGLNLGVLPACDAGSPPGFTYNPTAGATCLNAAGNSTDCTADVPLVAWPDGGNPCLGALVPTAPIGAPCPAGAGQEPCAPLPDGGPVLCVVPNDVTCSGTCQAFAAIGQSCNQGLSCGPGSFCDFTSGACSAYLSEGTACDDNFQCDPTTDYCGGPPDGGITTYCSPDVAPGGSCFLIGCGPGYFCGFADGGSGVGALGGTTCVAQLAAGAPCFSNVGGACASPDVCLTTTCISASASIGDTCGFSAGGDRFCTEGYCAQATDGGYVGTCTAFGGVGDLCPSGGTCQSGLFCYQGQCTAPVANGSACNGAVICATGYCSGVDGGAGVCTAYGAVAAPCSSSATCEPQLVCISGACAKVPTQGQACFPAGSSDSFQEGCALGDYCNGTDCATVGLPGATCTRAGTPSCFNSTCDDTGHCAPLLPPGSACDPTLFQCSSSASANDWADGGVTFTDGDCVPIFDGGYICEDNCP